MRRGKQSEEDNDKLVRHNIIYTLLARFLVARYFQQGGNNHFIMIISMQLSYM